MYTFCFFSRSIDKKVLQLIRENSMAKVSRLLEESHDRDYLTRLDMYTTLLHQAANPSTMPAALGWEAEHPPKRKPLPTPKVLRLAWEMYESQFVEDYRSQILSTFGTYLKFDSTKKVEHFV